LRDKSLSTTEQRGVKMKGGFLGDLLGGLGGD